MGFPLLFGPSKKGNVWVPSLPLTFVKGFLGGNDPSEKSWATAAAVTASIQQGADIIRVHDVLEMKPVVSVSDAIYKKK